jgi:MoaA/NifB/PqqE/SkfB family radical SAM enzyme
MKKRSILTIEVDSQGRLILPAEIGKQLGFTAGAKARLDVDNAGIHLSRSSENLARVYVEATNQCNLDCVTCMRNVWNEPPGRMSEAVFQCILDGVRGFQPTPSVFFGGYGEPLTHPRICAWVEQAKQAGAAVELITNGILLDEATLRRLMEAGLDRVWVSLDGATAESYEDVRLGAALPLVIENLRRIKALRGGMSADGLKLGIAFVAMKRNIADLPELVRLGKSLGADQFSVTNVLPHTRELRDQALYLQSLYECDQLPSEWKPLIALPRMDVNPQTGDSLTRLLKGHYLLSLAREELRMGADTCPFVEKASLSVRWDGAVSPCLALLHDFRSYLDDTLRESQAFSVGSLRERSLVEVWDDPRYRDLRERLLEFYFSPCVACNSCENAEANVEDCFGNVLPTCGGCLWAQGFIQCP